MTKTKTRDEVEQAPKMDVEKLFHAHDELFQDERDWAQSFDGSVRVTFEVITPEIAEKYLERNTNNRSLAKTTAETYTSDMVKNRWWLNTDAIGFDSNGALMNGQHRLQAVLDSKKAVEMMVVYGLDPMARATVDTQRKRSVADELRMRGVANNNQLAAAVRLRMAYMNNSVGMPHEYRPSHQDVIQFAELWEDEMQHAVARGRQVQSRLRLSLTAYICAYSLFVGFNPELADEYYDKLSTGANLEGTMLAVSRRLESMMQDTAKLPNHYVLYILIRGWNALRTGEVITKIQLPSGNITGPRMIQVR